MGNYNSKEIEIQVQIEKVNKLKSFLKTKAKLIGTEHQVDKYFSPNNGAFIKVRPINEWLRLRNSNGLFSVAYKNWHRKKDGKSDYCDEYETAIENSKEIEKIFSALKINPIVTVDKKRQVYLYDKYEFAIDSVVGIGDFVEIEYKGKLGKSKPSKIVSDMIKLLKNLECGKITRNHVGYPFQLLFPSEVQLEEA